MPDQPEESRSPWPSLGFLAIGGLISAYAWMAWRNGMPRVLWSTAAGFGPLLVLLGTYGLFRFLRPRR